MHSGEMHLIKLVSTKMMKPSEYSTVLILSIYDLNFTLHETSFIKCVSPVYTRLRFQEALYPNPVKYWKLSRYLEETIIIMLMGDVIIIES